MFQLQRSMLDFEALDPPRAPIKPVASTPPRPVAATPPAEGAVTSAYASCARNGRVRAPLGDEAGWALRWRRPLDGVDATAILATDDRILVTGQGWLLLTPDGDELARGRVVGGPPAIHPADGTFLVVEQGGVLAVRQLADGQPWLRTIPRGADGVVRPLLWRRGGRLVLAATRVPMDPHGHSHEPPRSHLEALGLGDPVEVDRGTGDLLSQQELGTLLVEGGPLLAAPMPDGEAFAIALPGHLARVGADLRPTAVFTDDFTPVALSVDDQGWSHLVVDVDGKRALWVVTPDGKRTVFRTLPPDMADCGRPPVLGLDRRIVVVAPGRVVGFDPSGAPSWERVPMAPPAGAIVTGDDRLLVAEGDRVIVYRADRDARVVHEPGARFTAGPCLSPQRLLLVATEGELLCYGRS